MQTTMSLCSLIVVALLCTVVMALPPTSFLDGRYILETTILNGQFLLVKATAETIGYVGFGISPNNSRIGTDLMIAGYDAQKQEGYIWDYYGREDPEPILDTQQNLLLVSASENGTHTTVEFLRLLNTGDEEQDVAVENQTQFIRWSFGVDDEMVNHGPDTRGTVELNLFD